MRSAIAGTVHYRAVRLAISIFCLVSAGLICTTSVGAATFVDRPVTYWFNDSGGSPVRFSFPFIESSDSLVARRINNALHLTILNIAPPEEPSAGATKIARDQVVGFASIASDGVVPIYHARVVNVMITTRGESSYSDSQSTYSFDARTGEPIGLQELLTSTGKKQLAIEIAKVRRGLIQATIEKLLRTATPRNNNGRLVENYRKCLRDRFTTERIIRSGGEFPGVMTLGEPNLTFTMASCLSQVDSVEDVVGPLTNSFSSEQLRPYLTPYAKYLLLGEEAGTLERTNPFNRVYRGKINGVVPVTFYLGSDFLGLDDPDLIGGKYYYDKYRKVIQLSMSRRGELFEFVENESLESPKPVLSFRIIGQELIGQWRGKGKTLSFEASP